MGRHSTEGYASRDLAPVVQNVPVIITDKLEVVQLYPTFSPCFFTTRFTIHAALAVLKSGLQQYFLLERDRKVEVRKAEVPSQIK